MLANKAGPTQVRERQQQAEQSAGGPRWKPVLASAFVLATLFAMTFRFMFNANPSVSAASMFYILSVLVIWAGWYGWAKLRRHGI